MDLQLSILDQSPVSEGLSAEEALRQTVELAQLAEKLDFHRFWVSEHHDTTSLAGSSPEVLLAYLAAKTNTIRLGSGGVMLPHYSPYKVAENFRLLEALAPGRIDAGMGRAPGGMPRATMALQNGWMRDTNRYPEQIDELLTYLHDTIHPEHPYYGMKTTPTTKTVPDVWLLGSSPSSAFLAAEKGLPYTFAQFINGDGGEQYMDRYLRNFKPSQYLKEPKNMVATFVACGETEEEAERLASSLDFSLLMLAQGMPSSGTPSPERAAAYTYSPFERARVQENRKRMVVGNPEQVKNELFRIAEAYQTKEIMLVSIIYDFEAKKKSFELIAEAVKAQKK